MNQPYTYLIGWTTHQKYYYGVRYARDCSPEDLWKKYFTSSPSVKAMKLLYGDPDIIQIRKTFNDIHKARLWETKVLRRMRVVQNMNFLNKNDAPAPPINNRIMSDSTKGKISAIHKGKPKSADHKQKIREARSHQIMAKGRVVSEETKQKLRDANIGKTFFPEVRATINAKRAMHDAPMLGKHHSEETKKKLSELNKGKKLTEEHRNKISASFKSKPLLTCPHCSVTGKTLSMTRHHFNNCKHKKE